MKRPKNFKKRGGKKGQSFWNDEYKNTPHLAISENPSEDLAKFIRFLQRREGSSDTNKTINVADLGCGNGRNLIYLAENFKIKGVGFDISSEAISQAKKASERFSIEYKVLNIAEKIPLEDNSEDLVLDMMVSHFLNKEQREKLRKEINRILKPGGWFFFKTFLLDEDSHAKRLLKDFPAPEEGSYIHPQIKVAEHVFTPEEIKKELGEDFEIVKILKSHGHLRHQAKRRSISVYARKI